MGVIALKNNGQPGIGATNNISLTQGGVEISNIRGLAALMKASEQFANLDNRAARHERSKVVPQIVAPLKGSLIQVGRASYQLQEFIGSGASGFVFKGRDPEGAQEFAIKISGKFLLPKGASLWNGDFGKDCFGQSFRSEVRALDCIKQSRLPDAQEIVQAGLVRNRSDYAIGVLVSKYIPGANLGQVENAVASGKYPIGLLGEGCANLICSALDLAKYGISLDDLALTHCRAQITAEKKLRGFAILDFGSARFYDLSDVDAALQDNLEAVQQSLIRPSPHSRLRIQIKNLFDYASDGISDLMSGDISIDELTTNLRDPAFISRL